MTEFDGRMQELLLVWTTGPMLSIALTLAAFMAANWLFAKVGGPLWMPADLRAAVVGPRL